MLCRIGVSSSVVVIASWSWIFLNFSRHSGKANPETLFTCRRVFLTDVFSLDLVRYQRLEGQVAQSV
jgi:hypothetical protein